MFQGISRKKRMIGGFGGALAALVVIFLIASGGDARSQVATVQVTRGPISETVVVTGKTKPSQKLDLAFERSGKVARVLTTVGAKVAQNQPLVQLDGGELGAQARQARGQLMSATAQRGNYLALLASQQARLDELKSGARSEELAIKDLEITRAKQDLSDLYTDIRTTLTDTYAKMDDVLRSKLSPLFTGSPSSGYALTYQTCQEQARTDATAQRSSMDRTLERGRDMLTQLATASPADAETALITAITDLSQLQQMLSRTQDTLNPNCNASDATLTTYRATVSTAIQSAVTAQNTIINLQQSIAAQKLTIERLQSERLLKQAGATTQQIASQEALVKQAEANLKAHEGQVAAAAATVQLYDAQLAKLTLRAPFAGQITRIDLTPGQLMSPGTPVIAMIGPENMEIEAHIPEVDVAKIAPNQPVSVTLDAIPGEQFAAHVLFVEPAETIVDGVVNFKVRILFDKQDPRIKSGLTANLTITVAAIENALLLPQYAIVEQDDGTFVQLPSSTADEKRLVRVTTGIRDNRGMVEIKEGVKENETVVSVGLKQTP